jgi:hypothetical protein
MDAVHALHVRFGTRRIRGAATSGSTPSAVATARPASAVMERENAMAAKQGTNTTGMGTSNQHIEPWLEITRERERASLMRTWGGW